MAKILDLPIYFSPAIIYHLSLIVSKRISTKKWKLSLLAGYLAILLFYGANCFTNLVVSTSNPIFDTSIITNALTSRPRILQYGPLMVPLAFIELFFLLISSKLFSVASKNNKPVYRFSVAGCLILTAFIGLVMALYYHYFPGLYLFSNLVIILALISISYPIIKNEFFQTSEPIFDSAFLYRTLGIILIISLNFVIFLVSGAQLTFPILVFLNLLLILTLLTHSFYDWFLTFTNDLIHNPSKGFSVVNDQEVSDAIKNYNSPDRLENSSLLRLALVRNKKEKHAPVDGLRQSIRDAIEYFKPEENTGRRTKRNLKYQMLRMIAYDQVDEGQILWELGFGEYPVRIMSQASRKVAPMFGEYTPADYTYTSRNAYLALKKEAIHDITWRISYLEKQAKRKLY